MHSARLHFPIMAFEVVWVSCMSHLCHTHYMHVMHLCISMDVALPRFICKVFYCMLYGCIPNGIHVLMGIPHAMLWCRPFSYPE